MQNFNYQILLFSHRSKSLFCFSSALAGAGATNQSIALTLEASGAAAALLHTFLAAEKSMCHFRGMSGLIANKLNYKY